MKKTRIAICGLLLLSVMSFLIALASIQTAFATLNGSVLYGIPGNMESNEAQATIDAGSTIRYYFSQTGDYAYLENYVGTSTQNYNVYSVANYLETYPYDSATVFYKGDSTVLTPSLGYTEDCPDNHNHVVLYDNDVSSTPPSNGGFENGLSYWTVGGPGDHKATSDDKYYDSYSMLLGFRDANNVANARDSAYQLVAIPSGLARVQLSFFYHLFTYDSADYDWLEVYVTPVGGNPNLVFQKGGDSFGSLQSYGWEKIVVDISAYSGQSVYIYFAVANMYDTQYKTWAYIDGVSARVNWIWDVEIGSRTVNDVHNFVFLWTCGSAIERGYIMDDHTCGMAASWLKSINLSVNGYNNPDYNDQAFIGFTSFSKPFTESTGYQSYTYETFITMFYYYATVGGYTINGALNQASQNYLGTPFANSTIFNGYYYQGNPSKMEVFGDGTMRLPQ